jgi:hypothetical protein
MSAHPFQNILDEANQIFTNRYLSNWQWLIPSQHSTCLTHPTILYGAPETNCKPGEPREDFDDNAFIERQRGED